MSPVTYIHPVISLPHADSHVVLVASVRNGFLGFDQIFFSYKSKSERSAELLLLLLLSFSASVRGCSRGRRVRWVMNEHQRDGDEWLLWAHLVFQPLRCLLSCGGRHGCTFACNQSHYLWFGAQASAGGGGGGGCGGSERPESPPTWISPVRPVDVS